MGLELILPNLRQKLSNKLLHKPNVIFVIERRDTRLLLLCQKYQFCDFVDTTPVGGNLL